MHKDEPDKIIAVRQNAPLIIGLGQGENFIASDIPAIIGKTRNIIHLADGELAVVRRESVEVKNLNGENVIKPVEEIEFSPDVISKLGYKHFMLKEINEQPDILRKCLANHLPAPDAPISVGDATLNPDVEKLRISVSLPAEHLCMPQCTHVLCGKNGCNCRYALKPPASTFTAET